MWRLKKNSVSDVFKTVVGVRACVRADKTDSEMEIMVRGHNNDSIGVAMCNNNTNR